MHNNIIILWLQEQQDTLANHDLQDYTLWYLPTKAAAAYVYVVRAQEWCPQESLATVNE